MTTVLEWSKRSRQAIRCSSARLSSAVDDLVGRGGVGDGVRDESPDDDDMMMSVVMGRRGGGIHCLAVRTHRALAIQGQSGEITG